MSNDYESKSKRIGSLFILVGIIVAIYTLFSPLTIHSILGVPLTAIGLLSIYLTNKINPSTPASWTKSLLITLTGVTFLLIDFSTLASITVFIGLFFLFGALNNFSFAYLTRQNATAYAWGLHGMLSLLFAYHILTNLQTVTDDQIGLYVALSLIADGLTLFYSGRKIFIRP